MVKNRRSTLSRKENDLHKKKIVFTGTLQTMTREKAQNLVTILQGDIQNTVTHQTDILVVGFRKQNLFDTDPYSKKELLARKYQNEGYAISILTEKEFFSLAVDQLEQLKNNLF